MGAIAPLISLSSRQEDILSKGVRAHKTSLQLSIRMQIILSAAQGLKTKEIASNLGVDKQRVSRWRRRWSQASSQLSEAETSDLSERDLPILIHRVLSDTYRSGAPPTFSGEQMTQIIALACEDPKESDYPVSHWTPKEIASEAIKRKIVSSISVRHVDRFLKGGGSASA